MKYQKTAHWIGLLAIPALIGTTMVSGQGQNTTTPPPQTAQKPPSTPTQQQQTVFRAATNYISTSVVVRDKDGKFIPDIAAAEFKVYEDGILQKPETFIRVVGGRSFTEVAAPPPTLRVSEGLILPKARPTNDSSGRIFIIFIDDLHLQVSDTPRVKAALKDIRDTLIHDNDLVGFVSTGTSAIEIDPTYDFGRRRFDEAMNKVMGQGMSVNDIIEQATFEGNQGPVGMRHNAHVAFETAYRMMTELGKINDRRKSFVYVSSGYTFDPFRDGRYTRIQQHYQENSDTPTETVDPNTGLDINKPINSPYDVDTPLADQNYMQKTEFAESDLIGELAQLTREARRANVVFYTLDPRGLTASAGIEVRQQLSYTDWRDYIMVQTNSLKVLGEETGGFCICQTNDYKKGLQRIDAETSDYYMIGYTSSNPDPLKIKREIKIEVSRPGVSQILYSGSYTIPKTKKPK